MSTKQIQWIKGTDQLPPDQKERPLLINGSLNIGNWSKHHELFMTERGDFFPEDQVEWLGEVVDAEKVVWTFDQLFLAMTRAEMETHYDGSEAFLYISEILKLVNQLNISDRRERLFQEATALLTPLLEWGHEQKDIPIGTSITTAILDRAKAWTEYFRKRTSYPVNVSLYIQLKDYVLSAWSASCVKKDDGQYFAADNGRRFIYFNGDPCGNNFLHLRTDGDTRTVFNGIVHDIEQLKLIMELSFI